ncbi:hypothetical protein ACFL27_11415 [candidate division CSSED10-310 bacterium]|uniref:Winged helix-turn-helix domain-containing protein n=1 Tax=candidate division CSSED10-310 bacterium TaxID=2855610 RepID=A0ABV6YX68_UNCC1
MKYTDFSAVIREELLKHPSGLTWTELRQSLSLPYDRPCQTWISRLEQEIGLSRTRGSGRAYVWRIRSEE